MSTLDPYKLMGVTIHTSLNTLKKSYHSLALLCHPDKGGNTDDMIIVHKAYQYIKNQLEFASTEEVVDRIYSFDEFISNNKDILPSYNQICKETTGFSFNEKFNQEFEKLNKNPLEFDNFKGGYSNTTTDSIINIEYILKIIFKNKYENIKIIDKIIMFLTYSNNEFNQELIIYKEPMALPDNYGFNQRFDIKETNDYTAENDSLIMSDYKKAYSGPMKHLKVNPKRAKTLDELIKQRDLIT